jgi:hypothetical protein
MEAIIITIYAAWFILTIVYQFRLKGINSFKRLDVLKLIPGWRFFAPDPLDEDFYLLYRDKKGDLVGEPELFSEKYSIFFGYLINPQRRIENGVGKLLSWFAEPGFAHWPPERQLSSYRYIYLLNLVMRYPIGKDTSRQFIVIRKTADKDSAPQVIFTSAFHGYQ